MIAAPPVRGLRIRLRWLLGLVLHSVSLVLAALMLGLVLHSIHGLMPRSAAAVLGCAILILAVYGTYRPDSVLLRSRWRVPRNWYRLGYPAYSSAFGAILGLGFLTAVPSNAFYAIVSWGLSASLLAGVLPVFLAFAVGRLLPLLIFAVRSLHSSAYPMTGRLNLISALASHIENPLLAAAGVALCASAFLT